MTQLSQPVLVVGPNPALDIVLETTRFVPGRVHRAMRSLHLAGGKPMIVARTLRRLGIGVCAVLPLGGNTGPRRVIIGACESLGIDLHVCEVREETRTDVIVVDIDKGESSVVNEPGPQLSMDEAANYERLVMEALEKDRLVLASGSLPPGLTEDFYARVAIRGRAAGACVVVDTSGEPLRCVLEADPWALKVNGDELRTVMKGSSVQEAAYRLADRVENVVVTLGAEGTLYVGSGGAMRVPPVPVTVANATGAGDTFLGGLAAGLVRGNSWSEALTLATAVGTLACTRLEPDIGPDPLVEEAKRKVQTLPM